MIDKLFDFFNYMLGQNNNSTDLDFGDIIGYSPNNIIAYSNNSAHLTKFTESENHIYYNTKCLFTGLKYQCVEYARRYLIYSLNLTFDQVSNAHEIFNLNHFININTNTQIPITKSSNKSSLRPRKHMLLIYDKFNSEHHETSITGHVAVITKVSTNHVYICEQNWSDTKWKSSYSRKLKLRSYIKNDLKYYEIMENNILGWIGFV